MKYQTAVMIIAGDGCLARAVRADVEYVRALDVDRLLAPFRREAGIRSSAHPYGHWESMGLDGHTLGHWLSAVSHLVASGNDADGELSRRLEYAVGELAKCQEKTGGRLDGIPGGGVVWDAVSRGDVGKVWERWAPWYNVHKTFAGLRDAWLEAGNVQAKATMTRLADWIVSTTANLDGAAMEKMLAQEFGGMNETFADLYAITGDEKYLAEAKRWEHHAVLDPLYRKEDKLTGLHANTQIPKFVGLARTGELADDRARLEAADFAWRTIVERRSVAFGGNSVGEHFHALDDFGKMLESREGPETCNTYNMLRLTEDGVTIYATPWGMAGKPRRGEATRLKAIISLERGEENRIWQVDSKTFYAEVIKASLRGNTPQEAVQILTLEQKVLENVVCCKMTSLNQIRYGSSVSRQGSTRWLISYHSYNRL